MDKKAKKIKQVTKLIPALKKVPEQDRLYVFNQAFKSVGYKLFLALIAILFVLVFYFNLDNILDYKGLERGGVIARNIHFLKALGFSFFLPLMIVFALLVFGRNYFVIQQIKKYEQNKNGTNS